MVFWFIFLFYFIWKHFICKLPGRNNIIASDCLISFNEIRHDLGRPYFSNAHSHVPVFISIVSYSLRFSHTSIFRDFFFLLHFPPRQFRFLTNKYLKSMKLELPYCKWTLCLTKFVSGDEQNLANCQRIGTEEIKQRYTCASQKSSEFPSGT